jgi:hypothetical protein
MNFKLKIFMKVINVGVGPKKLGKRILLQMKLA